MGATRIVTIAALTIGLGATWTAPAAAGDGAKKPKLAKDDPSRRVCKNVVPVGTRFGTRVCRTQAEWDGSMDKAQDSVLQSQMTDHTTLERAAGPR
ncbi:MAG TPA: hypothetical protein VFR28_10275 [Allosphingosinicella sp.]|jgi:hypothetical protein|nr:hypothetical protein [Allosphingosinicella sp.]